MSKLYLLMCTYGSYDDVHDTPIRAYTNKDIAITHAEKSNEYVRDFEDKRIRCGDAETVWRAFDATYLNPLDPVFIRYQYQNYWCTEVEVFI